MFTVTLIREFTQNRSQEKAIAFITRRVLSSRASWEITSTEFDEPIEKDFKYIYRVRLTFRKTSGQQGTIQKDWQSILEALEKVGKNAKFRPCVWRVEDSGIQPDAVTQQDVTEGRAKNAMANATGITLDEVRERCIEKINQLLTEKDAIQNSEFFRGIFEREAQIRVVLSSIKSFLDSNGERRNHLLLYGLPACAKTQILNSVAALLGQDAVVRLDGTSTTPAGIYKVYFENFNELPEPPFVILEEAEKTSEESLRVWLGALDERGELRKVNYREQMQRNLKVLCMATANDKREFDLLMGGTEKRAGALSSRFAHQIYCPRPNEKVLRLILERDIVQKGGKLNWIDLVIELAHLTRTDDPRKVLSFLDGGERLENGDYQKDILSVYKIEPPKVISSDEE